MTRTPAAPASRSGRPASSERPGLLRALGIAGWGALEPAILAALATESPILLIGPHGTAKTLLLQRLAEALGLAFRHYNASILSFDDLLGYPVPQDGRLVYLQTPATIWEAEAVLFDEVSRCRPELQNKLFPLVHERVAQGLPLTRLRHRWAAMNPPPGDQSAAADGVSYDGAEPLDVALADRFSFVLEVPVLGQLGEDDRRAVLLGGGRPQPDASDKLRGAVERCRALLAEAQDRLRGRAAEYVDVLAAKLAAAGHPLSTRRAVTLVRNVESLWAAQRALGGRRRATRGRLLRRRAILVARRGVGTAGGGARPPRRPPSGVGGRAPRRRLASPRAPRRDEPPPAHRARPAARPAAGRGRRGDRRRLLGPPATRAPRHFGRSLPAARLAAGSPGQHPRGRGGCVRRRRPERPRDRDRPPGRPRLEARHPRHAASRSSTRRARATAPCRTPPPS